MQIEQFNRHLKDYCAFRNESRLFKKLGWKTPNEWLAGRSINNVTGKNDEKIDIVTTSTKQEKAKYIKELEENNDRIGPKNAA